MKKYLKLILVFALISQTASSQMKYPIFELEKTMVRYVEESRDFFDLIAIGKLGRPSEAIFCVFEIDSTGRIKEIRFMADELNKDSAFAIIKQMKPSDFRSWKEESYKNKIIVIPFIVKNNDPKAHHPRFIDDLLISRNIENKNLILGRTIYYYWPQPIHETLNPSYTVPDDSLHLIRRADIK